MVNVSFLTVALSAGASVLTGYIGVLLNYSRQRQRQRRIYGLALLAEVKALHHLSRQYYGTFGRTGADFTSFRLPKLRFSTADTAVFNNVAGNVGLFSTRAAVAIIEYYSSVRSLAAQAQMLIEAQDEGADDADLRDRLADHLRFLRAAQRHGEEVVRVLRRETPTDASEKLRIARRRIALRVRRSRRVFFSEEKKQKTFVSAVADQ